MDSSPGEAGGGWEGATADKARLARSDADCPPLTLSVMLGGCVAGWLTLTLP